MPNPFRITLYMEVACGLSFKKPRLRKVRPCGSTKLQHRLGSLVSSAVDEMSLMGELENEKLSEVLSTYNCDGDEHFNCGLWVLM